VIVSSRKLDGCQHVADAIIAAAGKAIAIAIAIERCFELHDRGFVECGWGGFLS